MNEPWPDYCAIVVTAQDLASAQHTENQAKTSQPTHYDPYNVLVNSLFVLLPTNVFILISRKPLIYLLLVSHSVKKQQAVVPSHLISLI